MTDSNTPDLGAKPTGGEWKVCGGFTPSFSAITSDDGYIVYGFPERGITMERGKPAKVPDSDTQRANMRLIADAGTTFNLTGLTPSQLAEQRAELLAYAQMEVIGSGCDLPAYHAHIRKHGWDGIEPPRAFHERFRRAAISKAGGK